MIRKITQLILPNQPEESRILVEPFAAAAPLFLLPPRQPSTLVKLMRIPFSVCLVALLAAGSLPAQQVALTEHFNAVPPPGWSQVKNNPLANGWIKSTDNRAWHEDESSGIGACDDELISPVLDLSGYSAVYAHFKTQLAFPTYLANHPSTVGDGENDLYVRLNGGAWTEAWTDTRQAATTDTITVNLTGLAASQSVVEFAFRYYGTFAQEWWVDYVQISDSATPPIFGSFWTFNLPGTFKAVGGGVDDLESYAGTPPSHMALTAINATTGLADPEAWCRIAGGTYASASGVRNLEMGLIPGSTNYHNVRNAMVLGLNGAGQGNVTLNFKVIDHGEETHAVDGIWVSTDGAEWFQVYGPWTPLLTAWTAVTVDLTSVASKTNGNFYLAFAQEDNFPYANLDGIGIDDVETIGSGPPPFTLANTGTCGGPVTLDTTNGTPNGNVAILYGLAGTFTQNNANKPCLGLTLDIGAPTLGGVLTANGSGAAQLNFNAPVGACGATVQAVDISSCTKSNAIVL